MSKIFNFISVDDVSSKYYKIAIFCKVSFSSNVDRYSTRHAAGSYFYILFYRAVKQWNALPSSVTLESNIVGFKKKLRDYYLDKKG